MLLTTHRMPDLVVQGPQFDLPRRPTTPRAPSACLREVVAPGKKMQPPSLGNTSRAAPGFAATPHGGQRLIGRVQDYRVLLLDQRGTGLSSPITAQTLGA